MEQVTPSAAGTPSGLAHNLKLLLPAALLFVCLTGIQVWRSQGDPLSRVPAGGVPASKEIEERYGVQITGVHVVANGGLIDFRYRVVDAGKAKDFGHYTETSPLLTAEDSGRTVEVTIMGLHNHRVETGRSYYVLFRNTNNAIRPGTPVSVQIGNLRLQNLIAQ
ncbi:MAG: hypothetical protein ACM3US_13980 [Sphingomonadaceae bacterium]